ncbi:MAG TPA: DUF4147 domain-containing protein, partial [Thermoplasmata archaeon]|nr:DUF4147 domain-containing protein [Thermoplasmata archaeon]
MDPSPSFPFRVDERPRPQAAESVQKAAFRGAITGADAFPATRAAVRLDGELLRLGNRFVRWPKYREIAFIAAGNAAASQALAVNESLGERLTQGLVAGPDSLPPEVPFRSVRVPRGYPGSREGEEAGRLALELAQGLSEGDLLLLLLSPGAWTSLVAPPAGLAGAEFGRWLAELARRSSNSRLALLAAAAVGDGGSDGRLSEAPRGAEVVPIVVDRGDGAAVTGGSPARRLTDGERAEALAGAEAIDLLGPLP